MPPPPISIKLRDQGWCVVPLLPADEIKATRKAFWRAIASFPEYQAAVTSVADMAKDLTQHYVQGGFGALGNPASFHNSFVREWRTRALTSVVEQRIFAAIIQAHPAGGEHVRLEQLVDRMMIRRPSKRATAESWHRDEAIDCQDDDVVFGGWINFDETPQVLSAVPASHVGVIGHGGFAKLTAADADAATSRRQHLAVPPGHLLVFNEKLMHEVHPAPPATPQHTILRVFTGWRLTTATTPQLGAEALEAVLADQAVVRLKSGQTPKMYANMSWSQPGQRQQLEAWSRATFKPQCRQQRTVKASAKSKATAAPPSNAMALATPAATASSRAAPPSAAAPAVQPHNACEPPVQQVAEVRDMVEQQMRSLKAYGLPLYPLYSANERRMHYPHRAWTVTVNDEEYKLKLR